MTEQRNADEPSPRPDRRVQWGLALTFFWLGAAALYITTGMGWGRFLHQPLGDMGDFLDGAFAPLAFLWLVLGLFLQQRELVENNRAIQRQYELMRRTAEQAEIQTQAIAANELHARQDTFIDVSRMVTNQLEVIAALLFMSSQGSVGSGAVSDEEMDAMFTRLGTGEASLFTRRMISLSLAQATPLEDWELFYGTAIRKRHCDDFIRSFERLLRSAAACDPDGMIVDAMHAGAPGRLYRIMCEHRDAPPAGAVTESA